MVGRLLIVYNARKLRTPTFRVQDKIPNHLLNTRDMSSDVFNRDGIFDSKSVALAFYPGLVDKHSTISCETCYICLTSQLANRVGTVDTHRKRRDKRDHRA